MCGQKRILITGASGFIGGFLVKEALKRGYDVWAGIRPGSARENLQDGRIHFIHLKYDDREALTRQLLETVSVSGAWHYVVHNAGITKTLHLADFYTVNAHYTQVLLDSLVAADCKPEKFLLMSSLGSYGPVGESALRPICMDDEQRPDSVYGKSKLQAERFVRSQTAIPYVILRPTGVYGPGDKAYLMEIKSVQAGFDLKVGMKPQRLSFVYVKDLAVAAFLALENRAVCNTSYLVADGAVYTDCEFSKIIKEALGKRFVINVRIPFWLCYFACVCSELTGKLRHKAMTLNTDKYKILRQRNWACDTRQTCSELGFIPRYNLKEGLAETIRLGKAHGFVNN